MEDIEILEQRAIDAAINLKWDDAIMYNKQIIKIDKTNETAYLRLGFAHLQIKDLVNAKKYYHKALKIQPKNNVALQNLEKVSILEKGGTIQPIQEKKAFDPDLFIEVQGKTKIVSLTNLGQKTVLANLFTGEEVYLKIKRRKVEVRTHSGDYIGALPDDLSKRLIYFIKAKSEYVSYIKEATVTRIILFIREEKKGRAVAQYPSFPQNIQKNFEELALEEEKMDEEDQEEVVDTWEKILNEPSEEKEELIGIQTDDLDEESEE